MSGWFALPVTDAAEKFANEDAWTATPMPFPLIELANKKAASDWLSTVTPPPFPEIVSFAIAADE